jgi:hypothetical protein
MPAVSEINPRRGASPALSIEGSSTAWPSYGAKPAVLPPLDSISKGQRWIELFNRGDSPYRYTLRANQPWVQIDKPAGSVTSTERVLVSADWKTVPVGSSKAIIDVETDAGEKLAIELPIDNPADLPARGFRGHVESDRTIAIEAPHYTRVVNQPDAAWRTLPDFGRTLGGVTIFPVTASRRSPDAHSARLEYDLFLQSSGAVQIELHCAPSLDFLAGEGLGIAVSLDNAPPQMLKLETYSRAHWDRAVAENIRRITSRHIIDRPGQHTLKVWMITPGVVLERIVIDAGGVRPSYLGPPESLHISTPDQ